ncbi:hypothetical protein KvSKV_11940 [Ketogulonicigenium vulgare]|nr:hypothetical protein KvSKV_11940 [Ketogulonicigenium vulgare]
MLVQFGIPRRLDHLRRLQRTRAVNADAEADIAALAQAIVRSTAPLDMRAQTRLPARNLGLAGPHTHGGLLRHGLFRLTLGWRRRRGAGGACGRRRAARLFARRRWWRVGTARRAGNRRGDFLGDFL